MEEVVRKAWNIEIEAPRRTVELLKRQSNVNDDDAVLEEFLVRALAERKNPQEAMNQLTQRLDKGEFQ